LWILDTVNCRLATGYWKLITEDWRLKKGLVNAKIIFMTLFLIIFIFIRVASAQEYKIEAEDVLSITFWQQPELNTTACVRRDIHLNL
jgi:protein involved in polysaccharide export with SLBB domain